MKKIFILTALTVCVAGLSFMGVKSAQAYQNNSGYTNGWHGDGPDAIVFENGGSLTMKAGSSLVLASTSSLHESNVDYTAKSLTATYGVVGATGAFTGAVDIAGQVTMGAAGSKSTAATTGDISVGRDLAVARNADVTGQFATGAAGTKSTVTTTGDLSLARDINVGRNADITGTLTWGAAGSKSTAATTGDISVGRDLAVARNADVTGQFTTGGAGSKSTATATGDIYSGRDLYAGRNIDIAGTLTWGADGTRSTSTAAGELEVAASVTAPDIVGSTSVSGAKVSVTGGPLTLYSRAKAQILALTPTAAGEFYYCSDCTAVAACVSTGTVVGQWAKITDRTAPCD